jgi:molecular chaperone GrpE
MLREAAEFDNARKRWQREREELWGQAQAEVLIEMCEVWDNFERALQTNQGNEKSFEAFRKGVELIFAQFADALAKHDLNQYSCLGEEFDPGKAEAVGYLETKDVEHGRVVEELKKGFMLADRVLRPAQVIVARQIKELEEKEETGASASDVKEASDSTADEERIRNEGG